MSIDFEIKRWWSLLRRHIGRRFHAIDDTISILEGVKADTASSELSFAAIIVPLGDLGLAVRDGAAACGRAKCSFSDSVFSLLVEA